MASPLDLVPKLDTRLHPHLYEILYSLEGIKIVQDPISCNLIRIQVPCARDFVEMVFEFFPNSTLENVDVGLFGRPALMEKIEDTVAEVLDNWDLEDPICLLEVVESVQRISERFYSTKLPAETRETLNEVGISSSLLATHIFENDPSSLASLKIKVFPDSSIISRMKDESVMMTFRKYFLDLTFDYEVNSDVVSNVRIKPSLEISLVMDCNFNTRFIFTISDVCHFIKSTCRHKMSMETCRAINNMIKAKNFITALMSVFKGNLVNYNHNTFTEASIVLGSNPDRMGFFEVMLTKAHKEYDRVKILKVVKPSKRRLKSPMLTLRMEPQLLMTKPTKVAIAVYKTIMSK